MTENDAEQHRDWLKRLVEEAQLLAVTGDIAAAGLLAGRYRIERLTDTFEGRTTTSGVVLECHACGESLPSGRRSWEWIFHWDRYPDLGEDLFPRLALHETNLHTAAGIAARKRLREARDRPRTDQRRALPPTGDWAAARAALNPLAPTTEPEKT
jgi:hypothetical protein